MSRRQAILARIGGGVLGMAGGLILGAILGHQFLSIEDWERRELYGFIALARQVRGIGLGALIGGLLGSVAGVLLAGGTNLRDKRHLN